jgi:hypothetical protein
MPNSFLPGFGRTKVNLLFIDLTSVSYLVNSYNPPVMIDIIDNPPITDSQLEQISIFCCEGQGSNTFNIL